MQRMIKIKYVKNKNKKDQYYKIGKRKQNRKSNENQTHEKKDTKDRYYKIDRRNMKYKERKNPIPGKG